MHQNHTHKIEQILLIIVFFIAIWIPLIEMYIPFVPSAKSTEKRELSVMPKFNVKHLYSFLQDYQKYFDDNFGFRNNLITLNSALMLYAFHISPVPSVIIGKNGWLFYTNKGSNVLYSDPYSPQNLIDIKTVYDNETKLLATNNIFFVSFVAPDKQTVYSEYLPSTLSWEKPITRLDQRIKLLTPNAEFHEVNLLPSLQEGKRQHIIYYKTDTHWNEYGSFIAYEEIMRVLSRQFSGIEALRSTDFTIREMQKKPGGDLATYLSLPYGFEDTEVVFTPTKKALEKIAKSKKLEKLVIYRDSFSDSKYAWGMLRFLKYHFKNIEEVGVNFAFDNNFIIKEKPTVMMFESVERSI